MILSPDHLLVDLDGTYRFTRERVRAAWDAVAEKTREALRDPAVRGLVLLVGVPGSGKTTWLRSHEDPSLVYVDAVFPSRRSREPFVGLAREAGKPSLALVFTTPFETCLARNDLRHEGRRVPPEKMEQFRSELEAEPPTPDEGLTSVTWLPAS